MVADEGGESKNVSQPANKTAALNSMAQASLPRRDPPKLFVIAVSQALRKI
jgi:hypothetical protein